jgi:hypothetical protein
MLCLSSEFKKKGAYGVILTPTVRFYNTWKMSFLTLFQIQLKFEQVTKIFQLIKFTNKNKIPCIPQLGIDESLKSLKIQL